MAIAEAPMLRLATSGSVDDGKSTLIGRLLYDSKQVLTDQLEHVERARDGCAAPPLVAEVGVADAQLAQCREAEEGGEVEGVAEQWVRRDVVVACEDGDDRIRADELWCV